MFLCQNCLNRPLPLFQSICNFQNLLRASARFSFLLCYLDRLSECCRNYDWIVKVWLVVVNGSLASYFFYWWFWGLQLFFYIFSFFFDVVISALQVTWICLICIIFVSDFKKWRQLANDSFCSGRLLVFVRCFFHIIYLQIDVELTT